ncbi:hypothetical protein BJX65DRAFT_255238 [Aspergillus insuetus]
MHQFNSPSSLPLVTFPPRMGPYDAEINDQRRVELVSRIAARLHPNRLVEPGFWACIWLSDIEQLAKSANEIDRYFALSRLSIIGILCGPRL